MQPRHLSEAGRPAVSIEAAAGPTEDVRALVGELEDVLAAEYPPEQRHGLPLASLFQPHVRFFVARLDGEPAGCGGVALFDGFAEVKRMYVRPALRGRGVAQALLARIEAEARAARLPWLRLETGDKQRAAIRLYEREGFQRCAAFGDYALMTPRQIATSVLFERPVSPA